MLFFTGVDSCSRQGENRKGEQMAKLLATDFSDFSTPTSLPLWTTGTGLLASLPRGAITEILGPASSGRTSMMNAMLATATLGGEVVALIDSDNTFDPASARRAGVKLEKLLWVQCGHRLETALRSADLVLHAGGFGLIVLDLCHTVARALDRVPLSYWYRFQRAVENTPSILLILSHHSLAKSCARRQIALQAVKLDWRGDAPFQTIKRLATQATSRKPMSPGPLNLEVFAEA